MQAPSGRPNILLIVADDLGYGDRGAYGGKDIPTPNIDSIARNGVRFTNGYVSCPVCSPTRAGLMTGRYQQRFGHEFNPGPDDQADPQFGLPLAEKTLAERLKPLGYATGLVGKWHLGYTPDKHPQKRGFDEFFGFLGGAHPYLLGQPGRRDLILRGTEPAGEKSYLTDAFAREAVSFLERHQKQPFFLYLCFNAIHNPLQATPEYLARFEKIEDPRRRTLAAMLSAMDDGIGRVLGKLRQAKIEENTLIFFVSDNGGPTRQTTSRNDPLSGQKGQAMEGGIRVPFMMQWKAKLAGGKVYEPPVIALDVHPTAVAAAGGSIPESAQLDGVNLLPFASGSRSGRPHEALYWRFGPEAAARKGDWKILFQGGEAPRLYNLARDAGETNDLAAASPDKLQELRDAYEAWNRTLAEPRWRTRRAQGAKRKKA
jgi:arylsulfatase A-like enzyme